MTELLSVKNLNVRFELNNTYVQAVNDISFDVHHKQRLAIVGESGSGKSQVAFSILRILAKNAHVDGQIIYKNQNLLTIPKKEMNKIRFKKISIIFQDPMSSLNPYMRIGPQLSEVLEIHEGIKGNEALRRVIDILDAVQISNPKLCVKQYPHELSGGMRQRAMIAMAVLCNPELIIADEPTTALDVTVQAQVMKILNEILHEFGTSIVLITHDLGVVAGFCDDVIVMKSGQVMEKATTINLFDNPQHPYSKDLLAAIPNINKSRQDVYPLAEQ